MKFQSKTIVLFLLFTSANSYSDSIRSGGTKYWGEVIEITDGTVVFYSNCDKNAELTKSLAPPSSVGFDNKCDAPGLTPSGVVTTNACDSTEKFIILFEDGYFVYGEDFELADGTLVFVDESGTKWSGSIDLVNSISGNSLCNSIITKTRTRSGFRVHPDFSQI